MSKYKYSRLQEATFCIGQNDICIHAVVAQVCQPKDTQGSDKVLSMVVAEPNFSSPGLPINVFAPTFDALPRAERIGDIIRFHRLQMQVYDDSVQAVARVRPHNSQFLLFHGGGGGGGGGGDGSGRPYMPYQSSSERYTYEEQDTFAIDDLREWAGEHTFDIGKSEYLTKVEGVQPSKFFDLCCQVLYVDATSFEGTLIYHVWDGTDAPPAPPPSALQPPGGVKGGAPEEGHWRGAPPPPPLEVLRELPSLGSILPVVHAAGGGGGGAGHALTQTGGAFFPGQPAREGDWVKLRNIGCGLAGGALHAFMTPSSHVVSISQRARQVEDAKRAYSRRVAAGGAARKPLAGISLTVTDFEEWPRSTLREVLTHPKASCAWRSGPLSQRPTQTSVPRWVGGSGRSSRLRIELAPANGGRLTLEDGRRGGVGGGPRGGPGGRAMLPDFR